MTDRADEELYSPKRTEILFVLKQVYAKKISQNLPIYGIGSVNLKQFMSSDRD